MVARCAALALSLFFLGTSAALALTQQDCNAIAARGDYGGGLNCMQRLQAEQNAEMGRRTQQIVQQAMQNPDCQAKYQQFRARGGQLPFDQYAYLYAATGGFTPRGIAYFRQTEARNHANEMQAWQGVLDAEAARGGAQQEYMDRYHEGQNRAGLNLMSQGSYVNPNTGQTVQLPYIGPNTRFQDPQTGQVYARDDNGNFWAGQPNGTWSPMQPAR